MTNPSYDVTKLPQWAQRKIVRLEDSVQYYKGKLLQGDQPGSAITAEVAYQVVRGLPDTTRITFVMPDQAEIRACLTNDGNLELMHYGRFQRSNMVVLPRAGNVLEVLSVKR